MRSQRIPFPIAALASLVLALMAASACSTNPRCEELAEHMTGIFDAERSMPEAERGKLITRLTEACAENTPAKSVIDCALAAKDRAALLACEPPTAKAE